MFDAVWDNKSKQFIDCAPGSCGDAIRQAAKSIQRKTALIFGLIGAAILGAGTYLCLGMKKDK